jgi:FkbH-like protein
MSEDRDLHSKSFSKFVDELEARAAFGGLPSELRLRQAFERLILKDPKGAIDVLGIHQEEISRSGTDLGNLLGRTLLERKLYTETARLLQLTRQTKFISDTTICIRLAKALAQKSDSEGAAEAFRAALAIDPACISAMRGLYEIAAKGGLAEEASRWLTRLTETDVSYATTSYAHRERQKLPGSQGRAVRIAVLSSYVLDWLIPYLDVECRKAGLTPEFYLAPFNQYTQQILNPRSDLYQFNPDVIFLALGLEDICPELLASAKENELVQAQGVVLGQVLGLVREIESHCGALTVVHSFSALGRDGLGILQNRLANSVLKSLVTLNDALAAELRTHERTFLLPLDAVVGWVGRERSHQAKLWYMASMRIAEAAFPELARFSVRYVKALKGLTRKCVVLDLDGTLWGGIVGEVGAEGVALGPTAPGIEYVDFQRTLLGLTRRGILLAVCSKNNPEDALPVIRTHPHMVLREAQFAAMRINWKNKADNIREIAQELNIGLDSLVFFDDNPNERELIRQVLPEVLTVDLPKDPALYRRTVEDMTDFDLLALTKEDEMRVAQYQANAKRQAAKSTAVSLDEYLHSLNIQIAISPATRDALNRVVQLFNKTNQFNLTTKRYQVEDVTRFMESEAYRLYDLHVADRFGDHGLVGTAVILTHGEEWRIDSLLMSCRVMGLGVETAFLERIYSDAVKERAVRLIGEYVQTKKNQSVEDFYAQHGFSLSSDENGRQEWKLNVMATPIKKPTWITVKTGGGTL